MCTALSLQSKDGHCFFGRTMDIPYDFHQSPLLVPRNYSLFNKVTGETWQNTYGILGMGMMAEQHPMLAEGMNEVGLACAGLNFPGLALYEDTLQENRLNLPAYDLILWILSKFSTVLEVKNAIHHVTLVNKPFAPQLPIPPLHWMVTDKTGESIVIETTETGTIVYDNKLGVMTNAPTFHWHLTNLNQYLGVSNQQPSPTSWGKQELISQGDGLGIQNLPGGSYSTARFVRAAFFRNHIQDLSTKDSTLSAFFHCLDGVSMISGSVTTPSQQEDETIYTCAMDLNDGIYYYHTKNNRRISAISFKKEQLKGSQCTLFPYETEQSIHWIN